MLIRRTHESDNQPPIIEYLKNIEPPIDPENQPPIIEYLKNVESPIIIYICTHLHEKHDAKSKYKKKQNQAPITLVDVIPFGA